VKLKRHHKTSSKCVSTMKRLTSGNDTFGICSQVYISSLEFLQIPHTEMKHNRTRRQLGLPGTAVLNKTSFNIN